MFEIRNALTASSYHSAFGSVYLLSLKSYSHYINTLYASIDYTFVTLTSVKMVMKFFLLTKLYLAMILEAVEHNLDFPKHLVPR